MSTRGPGHVRRDPKAVRRGRVLLGVLVLVLVVIAVIAVRAIAGGSTPDAEASAPADPSSAAASPAASSSEPTASDTPTPAASDSFDMSAESLTDPSSIWVVVNKLRPLDPANYAATDLVDVPVAHVYPPKLRQVASDAVVAMFADFHSETGLAMTSQSAYRSYGAQVTTYNGWVASLGKAQADSQSARPGYSEHQTGLALDISASPASCSLAACFGDTPQGTWLVDNAYKYGFILRYPEGLTAVTGYEYEPWHFRYVGVPLATEMHTTGIETLEQFFGLPDAPDYASAD